MSAPCYTGACELDDLTRAERNVLALMAEGLSNRGIAERRVVSEEGVEKHVCNIYWKLGLFHGAKPAFNRRVQAVLIYLRATEGDA